LGFLFFMAQVICKACGSIDRFYAQQKANNIVAYCEDCGSYIKNLPQGNPQAFYFGKYKDTLVSECNDLSYLKWAIENIKCTSSMKQALTDRILSLENMLR